MDDGEHRFLSLFSLSLFPVFFTPLFFLGCAIVAAFGTNQNPMTETEGGQAGAELGWVCGSDRWTRADRQTERQKDRQELLMLETVRLLEDTRAAADPLPPPGADGCLRGWGR